MIVESGSEIKDGFVVSISTISSENEIGLMAEETVKSLDLVEIMIKQMTAKFKHRMNDIDLICNISDGIFNKLPKSRLSHG